MMNFKKTHEVKVRDAKEFTKEEKEYICKRAKVIKKKNQSIRGKIVKGKNNEFLNRNW